MEALKHAYIEENPFEEAHKLEPTIEVDRIISLRTMTYVPPAFSTIKNFDRICTNLRARNITHNIRFEVGGYKFMVTLTLATRTLYFWILE